MKSTKIPPPKRGGTAKRLEQLLRELQAHDLDGYRALMQLVRSSVEKKSTKRLTAAAQ